MSLSDYLPYLYKLAYLLDLNNKDKAMILIRNKDDTYHFKVTYERNNVTSDGGEIFSIDADELDKIFTHIAKKTDKLRDKNK
jgi:hypothetical protein